MTDRQRPNDKTKEAERRDAEAEHGAPQVPSAAEAAAAERHPDVNPSTAQNYEEMLERGKDQQGEGRLP